MEKSDDNICKLTVPNMSTLVYDVSTTDIKKTFLNLYLDSATIYFVIF